jgi:hypothetical protein
VRLGGFATQSQERLERGRAQVREGLLQLHGKSEIMAAGKLDIERQSLRGAELPEDVEQVFVKNEPLALWRLEAEARQVGDGCFAPVENGVEKAMIETCLAAVGG